MALLTDRHFYALELFTKWSDPEMVQNGRERMQTACFSVKECTAFDSINLDHINRINDLVCSLVLCCKKSSDTRVVCLVASRCVKFALTVVTSAASTAFSSVSVTCAIKT